MPKYVRKTRRRNSKNTRKRGGENSVKNMSIREYNDILISKREQIDRLMKNHAALSENEQKKQDAATEEQIQALISSITKIREERTGITSLQNRKAELKDFINKHTAEIDNIKSRIIGIKETAKSSATATNRKRGENNSFLQKQLLNEITRLESNPIMVEYNANITELEEIEKKLRAIELNNARRRNLYNVKQKLDAERADLQSKKENPSLLTRAMRYFRKD